MEHHFDIEDAELYGIKEAILLYNIKHWCLKNKFNQRNFFDGKYWTYNTIEAFCKLFPYMTKDTIRRSLERLESMGAIGSGCYNDSPYDRTRWYCVLCEMDLAKMPNGSGEKAKCITDNKPNNKPNTISSSFLQFWEGYNKKVERKDCEKIWSKISEGNIFKIFEVLPKYIESTPDVKYRKNPATWLRGECWNDVIIVPKKQQSVSDRYSNIIERIKL